MSVWSKPTHETAAAAAAAAAASFNNANNIEGVQENSLKGIVDDYPTSMPSSAMEIPMLDGEYLQHQPEASDRMRTHLQQPSASTEAKGSEEQVPVAYKSRLTNISPPSRSFQDIDQQRRETHTSTSSGSRPGSFAFSSPYGHEVIPSPYAGHAALPYSPVAVASQQVAYSPSAAHSQSVYGHGQSVPAHSYPSPYKATMASPATSIAGLPLGYSHVPVAMTRHECVLQYQFPRSPLIPNPFASSGRMIPTTIPGQNEPVWVQTSAAGMMSGQFPHSSSVSGGTAMTTPIYAYPAASTAVQASKRQTQPYSYQSAPANFVNYGSTAQGSPHRGSPVRLEAGTFSPFAHASQRHSAQSQQAVHISPQYPVFSPRSIQPGTPLGYVPMRAPSANSSHFARKAASPFESMQQGHKSGHSW